MRQPTRRERFRPAEFVALAALFGAFIGVVVLLGSRQPQIALIWGGIAFIVGLVSLAMLELAAGPTDDGSDDRPVLDRHEPPPPPPDEPPSD